MLNGTNIEGADMVRPCQLVSFPGNYHGALQCEAMCNATQKCVAWTFHLNRGDKQWRCCVKSGVPGCHHAAGMWSGLKKKS